MFKNITDLAELERAKMIMLRRTKPADVPKLLKKYEEQKRRLNRSFKVKRPSLQRIDIIKDVQDCKSNVLTDCLYNEFSNILTINKANISYIIRDKNVMEDSIDIDINDDGIQITL